MAKTWEELEEEEALKHRKNILGAKSRRDIQKENERYEKARIRIGEMHTAQTLGADWRTNPKTLRNIQAQVQKARDEQKARSDADVAKAREDMASGKTSTLVGKGRDTSSPLEGKEGPVEARRAEPGKRVFKAMLIGDRSKDMVFDTREEADAYLASLGQRGAVAEVGGTPKEMERYKELAVSGAKKEEELKGLYAKRKESAKERSEKVRSGEITTQDAAALRAAQDIAETDPERAEQFQQAYARNVQARLDREAEIERQRIANVAAGKAGMPFGESQRITKIENRANRIARDLRSMYDKAVRAGNYEAALDIEGLIKETLGSDPSNITARRQFFREKLNRANPF